MNLRSNNLVKKVEEIKEEEKAKITYRGWAGHFIGSPKCSFRLNTLIEYKDIKIVVSTVGRMLMNSKIVEIGRGRYYETMAFRAIRKNGYWDADISRTVNFSSEWQYSNKYDENAVNDGHIKVVNEIVNGLESGHTYES